jgi:hypothetical protein
MAECIRRAWLVLGDGRSIALDDGDAGYACTELNLGWPEVREVVSPRPNATGTLDTSQYWGSRAVSANIRTLHGAAYPDALASAFAPYMRPDLRPELHYVLDRDADDNPERVLVLRSAGYSWPISGGRTRDIQLSWVAPDPIARDVEVKTSTAYAGSSAAVGRNYNLVHPRLYPPGGGSPSTGAPVVEGDVDVAPLLRIYGPATAARVEVEARDWQGGFVASYALQFEQSFVIGSGEYVEVDCDRHTAYRNGDRAQPVIASVLWLSSSWPVFHAAPDTNTLKLLAQSAGGITQVVASWRDGWLT